MIFFCFELAIAVIGALLAFWLKIPRPALHYSFSTQDILFIAAFSVPPLLMAVFFTSRLGLKISFLKEIFRRILSTPFGMFIRDGSILNFLILSAVAGFGEELLFRGVLQNKAGIAAASLIFGAFHFVSGAFFILASLIGAYLGGVFVWAGNNVIVPAAVHGIYDFVVLLLMKRILKNTPSEFSNGPSQ